LQTLNLIRIPKFLILKIPEVVWEKEVKIPGGQAQAEVACQIPGRMMTSVRKVARHRFSQGCLNFKKRRCMMLKMEQVSGIAGVAIVLTLTGCGGGSEGGSGSTLGTDASLSAGSAFSQPLFAFDNEIDFAPEGIQDKVIRSKYSKAGDVVSIKEEVVSGRELVPLVTTYVMTRTHVLKTEGVDAAAGIKSALMTNSTDTTYTFAPYTVEQGKSAGLVTFHYNVKPLSGLLLADSLNESFSLMPSQILKKKHLRDSGKTFPTGSESLVVSKVTNHEDMAEFSSDEVTELKSVAEWEPMFPEGTEFRHYSSRIWR